MESPNERLAVARAALARTRLELERARARNAKVALGVGVLFAVFAFVCALGAAGSVASGAEATAALLRGVFGIAFGGIAALLVRVGRTGLARVERDARLRATGVPGTATVLAFTESGYRVDGETPYALTLRVEVAGRAPFTIDVNERVPPSRPIAVDAKLPVLVDASGTEMMIDWWRD